MDEILRYTGDFPPPELWKRYPNWEFALDEEDIDGQDETTLRPAEDQTQIGEYIPYTAAEGLLANGERCLCAIELNQTIDGLSLYWKGEWYRLTRKVDRFNQFLTWEPYETSWLPEDERGLSLTLRDSAVFPLQVGSVLPYYRTSAPIRFTIRPDGGEES